MPAKITNLQSELKALQKQRTDLDLDTLQTVYDDAASDHDARAAVEARSTGPDSRELVAARLAMGTARNALSNAKTRAQSLDDAMAPLNAMLTGAARATALQADADVLQARLRQAVEAVESAQTTCTNLVGLLADAQATHDMEREASARLLMQGAREGRALVVHPPERGTIDGFEAAHTMAQAELADAQAALAVVEAEHTDLLVHLKDAQRDAMSLAGELKMRDFAEFVVAYRAEHEWDYRPTGALKDRIAFLESRASES